MKYDLAMQLKIENGVTKVPLAIYLVNIANQIDSVYIVYYLISLCLVLL